MRFLGERMGERKKDALGSTGSTSESCPEQEEACWKEVGDVVRNGASWIGYTYGDSNPGLEARDEEE